VFAGVATDLVADKTLVLPDMLCTFDWGELEGVDNHHIKVMLLGRLVGMCRSHRSVPSHDGINALLLSVEFTHLFDPFLEVFQQVLHGEDHRNELLFKASAQAIYDRNIVCHSRLRHC
jgi:hypothetical protein